MEQWKQEDEELDLDDILKEFSGSEPDETEGILPDEDITLWASELTQEESASIVTSDDTVAFKPVSDDTVAFKPVSDDTVVFKPVNDDTVAFKPVNDDTIAFKPVNGEDYPDDFPPPEKPKTEPYSEKWEPEYEQPVGEYVPQEPIVFHPKSRLRELKKKLIAGPEKRYYELLEQGFGKLQMAIICCGLVAILSMVAVALDAMGMIPENRQRLFVFGQLLGLLLSALLGSYQLMAGVADLFKCRFSLNTLLLFSFIACAADGVLCLQQVRVPCCTPFSIHVTMSLWSAYQKRNTELGQMDTMRKAIRLDSVALEPDFYQGKPGVLRGEGQVEDFMDHYRVTPTPEKVMQIYALVALFISLGIGVTAGKLIGVETGFRFFSASLLVAVPASGHIVISRPAAILERRLHKLGTVLCGWKGVSALNTRMYFPLYGRDLFPAGTVKMNGLKFYGSRNPDQVVAYAAAVVVANGGGLAGVFSQMLESRNGYHYRVETLRHYPNGGIGGVVNEETVLVGTYSFMKEMEVEIPKNARVSQAVYVAVDGVLNGVFAIKYGKNKSTAGGLTTLCAYRGLMPVLTSGDFMLTKKFFSEKFGINTRRITFPEWEERDGLAVAQPGEEANVVALTTQEGLAGTAFAVTGSRVLRTASIAGVVVQMMGGILGLLIMLALAIVGAEYLLTPENLLLYELVWMIPGLLITEWTRCV